MSKFGCGEKKMKKNPIFCGCFSLFECLQSQCLWVIFVLETFCPMLTTPSESEERILKIKMERYLIDFKYWRPIGFQMKLFPTKKMQIITCPGHLYFKLNNFFDKMIVGYLAGDRGEAPAAYHSLGDSVNKTRFHPLSKFWRGWSWSWKCICCCKVGWGFRFITIFPGGRGMGNYKSTQIWLRVLMINQIISKSFYCEIHQLCLFYLVQNYSKVMETTTFGLGHTVVAWDHGLGSFICCFGCPRSLIWPSCHFYLCILWGYGKTSQMRIFRGERTA